MSIIPTGKRRDQVKQGDYKYDSLFGNDLFEKIAITGEMDLKESPPVNPTAPTELQQATNQGTLNFDRGMGANPFQDKRPEQNVQNNQHSPFLTDTGESLSDEDAQVNQGLLHERQKIMNVLQGGGFIMDLSNAGKDGAINLKLRPQPGLQITPEHYERLLQSLAKVGINPTQISDPDPNTGAMSISYKTNIEPEKVTKPGR